MLEQFMFKNVLSFKDETILDMRAINAYKEHSYNLIDINNDKYLKVATIYGANASGKSNIYNALAFFQKLVMESFNNVKDDGMTSIKEYYVPFSFEENEDNSEFEIIFINDGYRYKYGFEYNNNCIVSEWMYRKNIKYNRQMMIFERTTNTIELGPSIKKYCSMYENQIPHDALVLSFFNKLKLETEVFNAVYKFISEILILNSDICENRNFLKETMPAIIANRKDKFVEFLKAIDTGIKDISFEKREKDYVFFTTHIGRNGKEYYLDFFDESEGTIKSAVLYIFASVALTNNSCIFVDELNVKLHPLLLKFIIDLFYEEESIAQLIYTTHDTTLLDKKFFRRDQIWFVQKDEFGYSTFTSLAEFKVRSDASFEKDYLAGVYGGIPHIQDYELGGTNNGK